MKRTAIELHYDGCFRNTFTVRRNMHDGRHVDREGINPLYLTILHDSDIDDAMTRAMVHQNTFVPVMMKEERVRTIYSRIAL